MDLWVNKHKPGKLSDVMGQTKALGEISGFLRDWQPGQAMLIHGPTGVGKTLSIELVTKEKGHLLTQLNASDTRSSKGIEEFFGHSSRSKPLFHGGKIILIDEVDGIPGTDRGAVASIIKIIKDSIYPVFLIANDPWKTKLLPLRGYCNMIRFSKVHSASVEKRLKEICKEEGIGVEEGVLKSLARWSNGDLRSAISDLQIAAYGKEKLTDKDLKMLGYREREANVFNVLPTIFHSKSMSASKKAINNAGKDPDELFLWIETNLPNELRTPDNMQKGYDVLSKADIFRRWVSRQQNWRFRGFMVDMMSGVSLFRSDEKHGFSPYQPPQRIRMMGRSKKKRAVMNAMCERMGEFMHTSKRSVKRDYLPYFKIILKNQKKSKVSEDQKDGFFLATEEEKLIKAG